MASPNAIFTELVSTTMRNRAKEVVDNVSMNNALLRRILTKKQYMTESGGTTIVKPIDYANNSTYQRYSGYDVLNVGASDVITAAEYSWRQIAINVTANGLELRVNSGPQKMIDLVKARVKNALRTFKNNFSLDIYSDGTLPNQINGLQALVSDNGLGTVGGIDSGSWPFWQSKVQSAAAPIQGGAGITLSSTTIEGDFMQPLWMALTRGEDKPDLIVASNDYFSMFEKSQTSLKRYTVNTDADSGTADAGFDALKYKNADVIFDGNSGVPSSHMYFLDTEYIYLIVHEDANMEVMDQMKPVNQDAAVIPILWMGNMCETNRSLQGVAKP